MIVRPLAAFAAVLAAASLTVSSTAWAGPPIAAPFGTTPLQAVGFGTEGGPSQAVDATHGLPVLCISGCGGGSGGTVNTVIASTPTDRGGVIATAGVAQTLAAANPARRGIAVQNQSADPLYLSCSATATQDWHALLIAPGALYESVSVQVSPGVCSIVGPTAGDAFYAREF